jgi:hypothetical protein
MLTSVDFNDEFPFNANEIDEVTADLMLSPELVACQFAILQEIPKTLFGVGGILAQMFREMVWHLFDLS